MNRLFKNFQCLGLISVTILFLPSNIIESYNLTLYPSSLNIQIPKQFLITELLISLE